MATIVARSKVVQVRTEGFRRFAKLADEAAEDTVRRTIDTGARSARAIAPKGKERWRYADRPGYIPLQRSIRTRQRGKVGEWYSIAPHALHVEFGTAAHIIYGKLKFTWKGGFFYWDNPAFGPAEETGPGYDGYINWDRGGAWVRHPGTGAQPFLVPSYEVAKRRMMQIAREEYPG